MKFLKPENPAACIFIRSKRQYSSEESEGGMKEYDIAIGWIIDWQNYDTEAEEQTLDALEKLGFSNSLARKV